MSLRALLVILLVACAVAPAAAQTDRSYPYRAGYVVPVEGDTLRGWVEDRIALERARLVNFKTSEDAEPRTYYPDAALGYGFTDGARFATRRVTPDPDASPRNAFLRVLVEGPRSLYAHAYQPGEDRYYIEGEGFPIEGLYQIEKEVYRDGRYVHRTQRLYAGTLTRAFQDCSEARNAVEGVRYTTRSLTHAVIDYNRCVDPTYDVQPALHAEAERSRFAFRPTVWAGAGQDQLTTRRSDFSGMALTVGADLEVSVRGSITSRFSLLTGVSYRHHDVVYSGFDSAAYRNGLIALNLGIRYTHPASWAAPYVGASFTIGATVGSAQDEDSDLPAVYGDDLLRDDAESGYALELGLLRPLTSGMDLLLGFRYSETASFSGDTGSPRFDRQATSVRLGVRF